MPLPYYSKNQNRPFEHGPELLMIPDIVDALKGISKRPLNNFPKAYIQSFAKGHEFAENALYHCREVHETLKLDEPFESGLSIWKNTIRIYHELTSLVVELGKLKKMYEMYLHSLDFLIEGQQDLYHCDVLIEQVKEKDIEVQFKALMDKYHSLHEANIRYTLSLCIYSLDCISGHKDAEKKAPIEYCKEDVSYKLNKFDGCQQYNFRNDLNYLKRGATPNIRNSISHKTFEYHENGTVTFHDRKWAKTFKFGEFAKLVEALQINFYAQGNSMVLFEFDNHLQIKTLPIQHKTKSKKLLMIVDEVIRNLSFVPKNIDISEKNKCITCDIEKIPGFDNPTGYFGNLGGARFAKRNPGLKVDVQAYGIMINLLPQLEEYEQIKINIFEFKDKPIGEITYKVETLKKVVNKENHTLEDFKQNSIVDNI